jgi:hypothetical protein
MMMKRYVIERDLPAIGSLNREQLRDAAATSNAALAQLSGKVQWLQSFVADDKTFCIYLADDEASVREHAGLSGFPASKITEVRNVIDPMTATTWFERRLLISSAALLLKCTLGDGANGREDYIDRFGEAW